MSLSFREFFYTHYRQIYPQLEACCLLSTGSKGWELDDPERQGKESHFWLKQFLSFAFTILFKTLPTYRNCLQSHMTCFNVLNQGEQEKKIMCIWGFEFFITGTFIFLSNFSQKGFSTFSKFQKCQPCSNGILNRHMTESLLNIY